MKVFGLSKRPAPTPVLLIQDVEGRPLSLLACSRRVRTAGSPMPDFIRSSGDFSAPLLMMIRPFAAREMVDMTPLELAMTPVAVLPVRTTRLTQVPLCRWKFERVKAVCR